MEYIILLFTLFANVSTVEADSLCEVETVIDWTQYSLQPHEVSLEENYNPEWSEPEETARPTSLAVDPKGNVYIPDPANKRILVYEKDTRTVKEIKLRGVDAYDVVLFGIGLTSSGTIIVANKSVSKVQKYAMSGKLLDEFDWDPFYPVRIETKNDKKIYIFRPYAQEPLDQFDRDGYPIYPATKDYREERVDQYYGYTIEARGYGKRSRLNVYRGDKLVLNCSNLHLDDEIPPFLSKNGYLYFMSFHRSSNKKFQINRLLMPQ